MTSQSNKPKLVIMQVSCIYCKKEQYGIAVYDISHGEHPCVWCGNTPPVFTKNEDYIEALEAHS